jgi:hypothetical protein
MKTVNKKELREKVTDHINFLLARGYIDESEKDSMLKRYYDQLLKDNGYVGT